MRSVFMRYPEGKAKAVTFSYDDGVAQDVRLAELFCKYGIKATFEEMSKATGYLKFMGDILPSETGKNAELMMYKQGLDFMFTKFIDSQTDLNGFDNNRTLWELDLAQFVKDYNVKPLAIAAASFVA